MIKTVFAAFTLLLSLSVFANAGDKTAHDFNLKTIDGEAMPLSQYAGKVVLLVNTASKCGHTPQFEGLQALWSKYQDKGLVVLGVPSGNFKNQELATGEEIKDFCEINYGVDFPLAEKNDVIGENADPLYVWLKTKLGDESRPKWNFHKYLIDTKGNPVTFFPTKVKPQSAEVVARIEAELAKI